MESIIRPATKPNPQYAGPHPVAPKRSRAKLWSAFLVIMAVIILHVSDLPSRMLWFTADGTAIQRVIVGAMRAQQTLAYIPPPYQGRRLSKAADRVLLSRVHTTLARYYSAPALTQWQSIFDQTVRDARNVTGPYWRFDWVHVGHISLLYRAATIDAETQWEGTVPPQVSPNVGRENLTFDLVKTDAGWRITNEDFLDFADGYGP